MLQKVIYCSEAAFPNLVFSRCIGLQPPSSPTNRLMFWGAGDDRSGSQIHLGGEQRDIAYVHAVLIVLWGKLYYGHRVNFLFNHRHLFFAKAHSGNPERPERKQAGNSGGRKRQQNILCLKCIFSAAI